MKMPKPKTLVVALLVGYVLLMVLGKAPRPF
jgi:hypothetical protein